MLDWSYLDAASFRRSLRTGHGRALLCVRQRGNAPHIGAVLQACIRCHTHDWELEGHRAAWLWRVLDEGGLQDTLLPRIFAESPTLTRVEDADQICGLALLAAQAGRPDGGAHLRSALSHQPDPTQGIVAANQLVELYGLDGLLLVARHIGRHLLDGDTRYLDGLGLWLMHAEDQLGAAAVDEVLERVAAIDERVAAVVDSWDDSGADADPVHPPPAPDSVAPSERGSLLETVRTAALALVDGRPVPVSDPLLARALARLARHGLSELDPVLVTLDSHPSAEVRRQLSRLLAWHSHEALRALALAGPLGHPDRLRLLLNNFQPGDEHAIFASLDPSLTPRLRHDVSDLLLRLAARHSTVKWTSALFHIYRHAPCSLHREDALARLIDTADAPAWMLAEASWDAHPAVAEVAQEVVFA